MPRHYHSRLLRPSANTQHCSFRSKVNFERSLTDSETFETWLNGFVSIRRPCGVDGCSSIPESSATLPLQDWGGTLNCPS